MFKVSRNEWFLVGFMAVAGLVFTSRQWLLYLNVLNSWQGFLVYYGILFLAGFVLSKFGLSIVNIPVKSCLQLLGIVMITFSFFLIFNWENPYVQFVTTDHFEGASPVFFQTEDGITWWFWTDVLDVQDIPMARVLSFVVTPAVLTLLGSLFVARQRFGLL